MTGSDATANGGNASGSDDNGCGCEVDIFKGGDAGDGNAVVVQDQSADVANSTSQGGSATVDNAQENTNGAAGSAPVRKGGDDCGCEPEQPSSTGDVDQSNTADNSAVVVNANSTDQSVGQSQTGDATANGGNASGSGDAGDGNAVLEQGQSADVSNGTDQSGKAAVNNSQLNTNEPVNEHTADSTDYSKDCGCETDEPANGGDVSQSNNAGNEAAVMNGNSTAQRVGQAQTGDATASGGNADGRDEDSCGCEPTFTTFRGGGDDQPCGCESDDTDGDAGDGTAVVDQDQSADVSNGTDQSGTAAVDNDQENVNSGFGDVEQSNVVMNHAKLLNGNGTAQAALQRQLATALGHAA